MTKDAPTFAYYKDCPVCSSTLLAPYKKHTFDFVRLTKDQVKITDSEYGKVWDLSRCERCGHIFANPFPSPAFLHTLYRAVEDPNYQEEEEGRGKNFSRILSVLEKLLPEKGVLFDVGAATGILLNIARQRGWTPSGIEASAWAVQVARENYQINLYTGDFTSAALGKNLYQAVTMVDFIEHIPNPLEAVLKAREMIAERGILSVVTPDIHSLAAKITGRTWWHLRPGHLAYFSPESLAALLRRGGFRVVRSKRYSWTFSAHYLLSRGKHFKFLMKDPHLASLWKKIPIKLALGDSFEIYAAPHT